MKKTEPIALKISELIDEDLIFNRIAIEKEIKKRGLKFNVGHIGETLAIEYCNATPGLPKLLKANTGTKNVDALSRKGERYSIKTIKDGRKTGTVYPDDNRQLFEYLLIVQINDDYDLEAIHQFSWKQFLKVRQWDKTMNAWYISRTQKALKEGVIIYEKQNDE